MSVGYWLISYPYMWNSNLRDFRKSRRFVVAQSGSEYEVIHSKLLIVLVIQPKGSRKATKLSPSDGK